MDFSKNIPGHICAKQGDTNSRRVILRMYDNGIPWTVPQTAVPVIRYQCLPGGSCGVYDTLDNGSPAWEVSGNEIRVILAPQILAEAGTALMDIALLDAGAVLATYNIHVHVESSPQDGTALQQKDYFNLAKITAAHEELKQATIQTITATAEATLATIPAAVATWLEAHPEATTTVADGSITVEKTDFIQYITLQRPDVLIPRFTNQIPISTDAAGNQLGIVKDIRLVPYTGTTEAQAGFDTTGYIPLTGAGDVLRFQNLTFSENAACCLAFFQQDKTFIGAVSGAAIAGDTAFADRYTLDGSGNFTSIDLTDKEHFFTDDQGVTAGYLRITAHTMESNAVATVNEVISYITIPGSEEIANLTLDKRITVPQAKENADAIAALTKRVAALEKLAGL